MSAFAERVLANVREQIRAEVAYALELAGEPELLEALRSVADLLPALDGMDRSRRLLTERVRAAIASAEGR